MNAVGSGMQKESRQENGGFQIQTERLLVAHDDCRSATPLITESGIDNVVED